jgi:hypothetical protein
MAVGGGRTAAAVDCAAAVVIRGGRAARRALAGAPTSIRPAHPRPGEAPRKQSGDRIAPGRQRRDPLLARVRALARTGAPLPAQRARCAC